MKHQKIPKLSGIKTASLFCRAATIVLLAFSSCERDENGFDLNSGDGEKLENVIRITAVSALEPEADSEAAAVIKVSISGNTDSVYRNVTYHTDLGLFPNNDTIINVAVNGYGQASVALISDRAGIANVRVTVKNISVDTSISFRTALPDDMLLSAGNYVLKTTDSTTITAELFRNTGKPSDNMKVLFTATPDNAGHDLVLSEFAFTEDGAATVLLKNPFGHSDWYTITARTQQVGGATLEKSIRIRIDP